MPQRKGCAKAPGSGKKKGFKFPATLAKEAARELTRTLVTEHIRSLVEGQVANAQGLKYLVARDKKTGRFNRVLNIRAKLRSGEESIEVWEKDPSVEAFRTLLDRALDRPLDRMDVQVSEDWKEKAAFLSAARGRSGTEKT